MSEKRPPPLGEARVWGARQLQGTDTPLLDTRVLLGHVLNLSPLEVLLHPQQLLTLDQWDHYQALLQRRQAGEPVSRIIGFREFWSLTFRVTEATLDPRPDSETAVELALSFLKDSTFPWRLMDWGTGTGCLLLSLLWERPAAWGVGVDRSFEALQVARHNGQALGLSARCGWVGGEWGQAFHGDMDLIISNPPYIERDKIAQLAPEVRFYDPWMALEGGVSGLEAYEALIPQAYRCLKPGGVLVLEIGQGQDPAVFSLLHQAGFQETQGQKDLAGIPRALAGRKPFL